MTHTPEPWEYANSGLMDVVYAKDAIGADRRICELIGPDGVENGHLISAAPELLRSLEELLPKALTDNCTEDQQIEHWEYAQTLGDALAPIALRAYRAVRKARGESRGEKL